MTQIKEEEKKTHKTQNFILPIYQFCFTTKINRTTKLENIIPSKEEVAGIWLQNLTQALFVFKEKASSNLTQFSKISQN